MTYYKILKGTSVVVFKHLWSGENKRPKTKRDVYFSEEDVYDFGEHGPEGIMYFMVPKNPKGILAIGCETRWIKMVDGPYEV